ncbi:MAG: PAS domain-containing protein [Alphaproteobacteria bacterium]|nr:PAS domain-containing protein [Alphaproteobacteria bacterium]MBV9373091.1 PAS domain-containing protein [Alphaproteobacteria bacterium]MBV9902879.1 PAS domain-containing protein [Alphaproteobacteria bacterium]
MRSVDDADLAPLLEPLLEAAISMQRADFGDIALYDSDQRTLRIVAHRGVGQEFLDRFGCIDGTDPSACRDAARGGQRVIVEDVEAYAPYAPHRSVAAKTGYRGLSCTAVKERGTGRPLGMLTTLFREPYRPDAAQLRLSDLFADQAADLVSSRRAQRALRETEEFFRFALEAGGLGTWEWDFETRLITADAVHQALFGMGPQERPMPAEAYWRPMDPEAEGAGNGSAGEALDQGEDIQLEFPVRLLNGEWRWIAVRGRRHHDGSDSIVGVSYDVTERNARERSLRENQQFLAAILDQVPGGVGLFDGDGRLLLRGGPLGKLWGDMMPSADPAAGESWQGYYADGRPIATSDYPGQRALRGDVVAPGLDFLHTDDRGETRWFRVSAAPFRRDREVAGAVAYIENVDREKRSEERLRQSEERLKSAVGLAGLGLYSIEIEGGTSRLEWDDRVRMMWGLSDRAKVTLQVWLDGIHPEDRDRVEAAVARAYDPAGDGVYEAEYRVLGADGVERWLATRGETRFRNGRPVSFLGVALDVTERKMIEQGLRLVVEMRNSELQEASATREAETKAHERVSERLELLQAELSRGLFAALENRQKGSSAGTNRRFAEAARKIADLSPREREVLDGLLAGEPHKKIARRLGISVRTVELHRTRMLHRLGTPHLAEAIRLAVLAELAAP